VNALNDVFFWDAQTGWAVGEKGTILHTDDGGETWQWQDSPVDGSLEHVVFVDAQMGWIAYPRWNDASVLLQTQDGGRTWVERSLPFQNDYDMIWADANNGWLVSSRQVFHSSDGGETWQEQSLPQQDQRWEFIASVDDRHVWATTRDVILHTDDGGVTWTSYPLAQALSETPVYLEDLVFVDAQTGWAILGDNTIAHTTDGGQTWQAQYTEDGSRIYQLDFEDARTGWAWNSDIMWRTTDGGATWEKHEMTPWNRRDVTFLDKRHAWAVGGWMIGPRSTIAYSDDGGVTWQLWDQHIVVPPLAYTSAARLASYLRQQAPPVDALLLRLFPDACWPFARYDLVSTALHNLGWNGTDWGEPPVVPQESHVRRLDADLDQDGQGEIILYGGGRRGTPLASVLDWDGIQWQVALNRSPSPYYWVGGNVWVHLEHSKVDGRLELWIEELNGFTGGTGIVEEHRDTSVVRCNHLDCRSVWRVGGWIKRWCGWYNGAAYVYGYDWGGSEYHFIDRDGGTRPEIESQHYGLTLRRPYGKDPISSTLEVQILPTTQTIYRWDGAQYTPTVEIELEPGYELDTRPVTETVDLDGDGDLERAVYHWVPDCDGLWQTLTIYDRDKGGAWQPTQVFTAAVTGAPSAGLSLQDVDDDGRFEVVECATFFLLTSDLAEIEEWPSMQPRCTIYGWDYVSRRFKPHFQP
jgi:photosystem II stability/assembly factor-like uncharacterized protein